MPLTSDQQAALDRCDNYYDGDSAYNAATNPGGFRQGGHLINFVKSLKDVASIVKGAASLVADAVAASANSPKALRVDSAQAFLPSERGTARSNLKLPTSSYIAAQGNLSLTKDDVGTTFYVDATRTITLPLLSDCVVGDTIEFFVYAGTLTLTQPAGNPNPIGLPGSTAATVALAAGTYAVKSHGASWRVHNPPAPAAVDLSSRVAKIGDTMTGTLTMAGSVGARFLAAASGSNAAADWLVHGIAGNRLQFCDGAQTVEYMSVGTDGSISTRQFGDLNARIEARASAYASSATTGYQLWSNLVNSGYATSSYSGSYICSRDSVGRAQFKDGINYGVGYCMVGDSVLGQMTWAGSYIQINIGSGGNFYAISVQASDKRLKENIVPVESETETAKVDQLKFYGFDWNKKAAPLTGHVNLGIIAQEAREIDPEWIIITDDDKHQPNVYRMLVSTMKALQESNARIRALEVTCARLEAL